MSACSLPEERLIECIVPQKGTLKKVGKENLTVVGSCCNPPGLLQELSEAAEKSKMSRGIAMEASTVVLKKGQE